MNLFARVAAVAGIVAIAVTLSVCGGDSPATNTPTTTPPVTTTVAAVPSPSPRPSPSPSPLGPLQFASCVRIGFGTPSHGECPQQSPSFLSQVDLAIEQTIRENPEVFSFDDQLAAGIFRVAKPGAYHLAVMQKLDRMGLCAEKGADEIAVKDSNGFHDQYQILVSSGYLRRGLGSYRATCSPAQFPVPESPLPNVPGCTLGGSRDIGCSREGTSRFYDEVETALDNLIRDEPGLFDLGDRLKGTDWPKVVNVEAFHRAMIAQMTKKGYCAVSDEELGVKESNKVSETFDILTFDNYIRRGFGQYRSTCYPAAF